MQLRAGARALANVENSLFITDTWLDEQINQGVSELYDLVVSVGETYYASSFTFSLTGGQTGNAQSLSALTGGFYKDGTLEKNPATSNMRVVRRLGARMERGQASGIVYDIIGTPPQLIVYPPELSSGAYKLWFVPDAPVVTTGGGAVDLDATLTRWYQYVEIYAAIQVNTRRGKIQEVLVLAGSEDAPQPGTLAHHKRRVLTMARNKMEQPQQVPMAPSSSFWDEPNS